MKTLLFWLVILMPGCGAGTPTVSVVNGQPCVTLIGNLPRNEGPITVTVTTDDGGVQTCVSAIEIDAGLSKALKETEFRKLDGG